MSDAKIQPGNAGSLITPATPAVVLQLSVDLLFKYNPACELNTDRLEKKLWKREKKKILNNSKTGASHNIQIVCSAKMC